MKHINYELALRALNHAVALKGYDYVDPRADIGVQCTNTRVTVEGVWKPGCIVGTALVWLGVPAEWFYEAGCNGASSSRTLEMLALSGLMKFDDEAEYLLGRAQAEQDRKSTWGRAVALAHLGDEWFNSLQPR